MPRFFDYDPQTGVLERTEADGDKLRIRTEQDVEKVIERNKRLANEGATDIGIKKGLWHAFTLPATVQMEIMKKGINPHPRTKKEWKRLLAEVETNYPAFKTTHKRLA